ncbi:hypothetical protein RchiOBHm_Chr7g0224001 [Rosa chinensis]|uniref:Uncharacterized protein n=1 Tax=Rosa chinensis TaxID=74649 RepID=A0A2P6PDP7_ROSCH|nr:hypothetical protein RchiOBHm_Chr7g0224001 [Rosa chinensis]
MTLMAVYRLVPCPLCLHSPYPLCHILTRNLLHSFTNCMHNHFLHLQLVLMGSVVCRKWETKSSATLIQDFKFLT